MRTRSWIAMATMGTLIFGVACGGLEEAEDTDRNATTFEVPKIDVTCTVPMADGVDQDIYGKDLTIKALPIFKGCAVELKPCNLIENEDNRTKCEQQKRAARCKSGMQCWHEDALSCDVSAAVPTHTISGVCDFQTPRQDDVTRYTGCRPQYSFYGRDMLQEIDQNPKIFEHDHQGRLNACDFLNSGKICAPAKTTETWCADAISGKEWQKKGLLPCIAPWDDGSNIRTFTKNVTTYTCQAHAELGCKNLLNGQVNLFGQCGPNKYCVPDGSRGDLISCKQLDIRKLFESGAFGE